jgi:acetyl esterase
MSLHPKAQQMVEANRASGGRPIFRMTPVQMRVALNASNENTAPVEPVAGVEDFTIPSLYWEQPVRVYRPENANGKGLIFYHGGGFCSCSIDTHDLFVRILTNASGRTIITPEYRLAPQHKWPAAIEDGINSAQWVYNNCEKLDIERETLAIAGDSAGGTIATTVCQFFADTNGPKFAKQIMYYPGTDFVIPGTPSIKDMDPYVIVNRDYMIWVSMNYYDPETDLNAPYVLPLRAKDVSGQPSTYLAVAEWDTLRDEGRLYAEKLKKAGVEVKFKVAEGLLHAFLMNPKEFDMAMEVLQESVDFLDK